ncbi:MAG: class I SAM-dependent methyltransferase [Alphaproteobacteria bacterium]|jgi:cyclopropane fatty-acyl-phospholipid synthase-like methyltransferase|nr:class I SAM-dependent methyltransferase [Alphaproteobacteria bacterium]MBT4019310.1 class I SAM-dependent methyltransferase [Alphaproteobacteria bacterium]MBT4966561.1 class I SAM-dependent methyltransferase [Alphaproteobacteria bacterium]MBT5160436.1 class I SAM-dependent methyltransferase [Alphaproteobacteria bacterium]MBT6384222.1 class I SAM-dependent methyltransferase [Alphaproteobacteria bacterium]
MNDTPKDLWNRRYEADGFLFGREPNAFVKSQAHLFKAGMDVLSIADGEGRNGVYVARQGANVTSVDFSEAAQEKARGLADEHGVEVTFEQRDVYNWDDVTGDFDVVLAIFIQFAPPEKRGKLFEDIKRLVKPGGLVVMQGYRPEQVDFKTGGPPNAENMYTAELLRNAFPDFDIQHLVEHDSVVDEGIGHSGLSALVDMVARKPEQP